MLFRSRLTLDNNLQNQPLHPDTISAKLPRYPTLAATPIGRLALDEKYHKKGLGEIVLFDALKRRYETSLQVASMAVIVEAKTMAQ